MAKGKRAGRAIEFIPIDSLTLDPENARRHKDDVAAIARSLAQFGQQTPIVVTSDNLIIKGNGTTLAAMSLEWSEIQAVRTTLTGAELRAYAIADNRTAELSEWDVDKLLVQLGKLEGDLYAATGFTNDDLEKLIGDVDSIVKDALDESEEPEEPEAAEPEEEPEIEGTAVEVRILEDDVPESVGKVVVRPGDLFILGRHRLLCGDSRNVSDVARLMAGRRARLCFTSPPYGGQRKYTGEIELQSEGSWFDLMRGVFGTLNTVMEADGQVLVNLGLVHTDGEVDEYWRDWLDFMRVEGWRRFAWYVWDQGSGLPGHWQGRYAPSFEFVFHFNKVGIQPTKFIAKAEGSIRDRTGDAAMRGDAGETQRMGNGKSSLSPTKIPDSVIRITRQTGRVMPDKHHSAVFPVRLPAFVMQSWRGLAYEPFTGSGSSIIAAEQLGEDCYGMEISAEYCQMAIERWVRLTGGEPRRENDGRLFSELMAEES